MLIIKARPKPETWHHYLPPSSISKLTLSGVLGHLKYHFFPSNNIAFFCLCFYPSSQLMFSSLNCNILAVGQCAPLPRRTIHHKIHIVSGHCESLVDNSIMQAVCYWNPPSALHLPRLFHHQPRHLRCTLHLPPLQSRDTCPTLHLQKMHPAQPRPGLVPPNHHYIYSYCDNHYNSYSYV